MFVAELATRSFPDVRSAVRRALGDAHLDMFARASRDVPPQFRGTYGFHSIQAMIELSLEAIETADYTVLTDWVHKTVMYGSKTDAVQRIIISLKNEIVSVCSRAIPKPCPLMGEIFVQFSRIEDIARKANSAGAHGHEKLGHNPIDVAVDEIIASLNKKDIATGEHSRAVSSWCHRIARKLALSEEHTAMVTRGGLIHDIGKTTVPIEILAAPRRLSDEEWTIMASHVTAGHEMLLQIPVLHDFQSIVRHHHERIDGGGYPDKLSGGEIPLLTRVVTVADCFNAMIGRRPYRKAMSPLTAIGEIRKHRGNQFDPDVTDAMTEVVYEMSKKEGMAMPPDWRWKPPQTSSEL